jgi:hypothetical protein
MMRAVALVFGWSGIGKKLLWRSDIKDNIFIVKPRQAS